MSLIVSLLLLLMFVFLILVTLVLVSPGSETLKEVSYKTWIRFLLDFMLSSLHSFIGNHLSEECILHRIKLLFIHVFAFFSMANQVLHLHHLLVLLHLATLPMARLSRLIQLVNHLLNHSFILFVLSWVLLAGDFILRGNWLASSK